MTLTQAPPPDAAGEIKSCPFCGAPLRIREGVNAYGRCDTEGCWMNARACTVPLADAVQVRAWNTRAATPTDPLRSLSVGEAELAPFADYHGDLPDYDHPLRCVYESGIQYAVELLAKMLQVENWEICDGTEEFDGDLGGTLLNIVLAAMPKNADGDPYYPQELEAALSQSNAAQARGFAEGIEAAAKVVELSTKKAWWYGRSNLAYNLNVELGTIATAIRALSQGSGSTDGGAA